MVDVTNQNIDIQNERQPSDFVLGDLLKNPDLLNKVPDSDLNGLIHEAESKYKKGQNRFTCDAKKHDQLKSTNHLTYHTICDQSEVRADFENLLGAENVARLKDKNEFYFKKTLNTQFGETTLNITYRAEYSDIYIFLPSTQNLSMRIELDEQFNPKTFILIDDKSSYFSTIFSEAGLSKFSQNMGDPNLEALQRTFKTQAESQKTNTMLKEMTADMNRRMNIAETYHGEPGIFVEQAYFKVAPIDTPLATAGINTCAGLVVIDKNKGIHYLAHVDPGVSVEQLRQSLQQFGNFENQEIYFMEGVMPSGTLQNMLTSILDNPEALKKVQFLHGDGKLFNNVAIHNGEIFNAPENTEEWTKRSSQKF